MELARERNKRYYHKDLNDSRDKGRKKHHRYRDKYRNRQKERENSPRGRYQTYKKGAKYRGLVFDISFEDFNNIVSKVCFYCGNVGGGLDRMDSSMGYIKNNVVPCCSQCNYMKLDYSVDEFINKCKEIALNN